MNKRRVQSAALITIGICLIIYISSRFTERPLLPLYAPPVKHHRPITVFIHGTLPSLLASLIQRFDLPLGLHRADTINPRFILSKAGIWLHEGDPEQFPLDSIYLFSWPGALDFESRMQAAEHLYLALREYEGPITVIGHSHGGNVALLLAYAAQKYNDSRFTVERLVLLATPVQVATMRYVASPLFKRIYSLYSRYDLIQIADPQRVYKYTRMLKESPKPPLLSGRVFPAQPNLIQARISMGRLSPAHIHFILATFLHQLGTLLSVLDQYINNNTTLPSTSRHVLIQMSSNEKPRIVKQL